MACGGCKQRGRGGFHSHAGTSRSFNLYSVRVWVIASLLVQAGLSRQRALSCLVVIAG